LLAARALGVSESSQGMQIPAAFLREAGKAAMLDFSQRPMKKSAVILALTVLVLSLSGSIAIDPTTLTKEAAAEAAEAKALCNPLLPGYIEALARTQESLDGYNKQLNVACTPVQVAESKNVQFTTNMMEMLENLPPTVDPLQDASLLSQLGEDTCKVMVLLIKSTSARIDSLVCTIGGLKAQCAQQVCGDYNAQLQAKVIAMDADFKTKIEQANKDNQFLTEQNKKLQDANAVLTRNLKEANDVNDKANRDIDSARESAKNAQTKFASDIEKCNQRFETCDASLGVCTAKIVGDAKFDAEKLQKCNDREKATNDREKATNEKAEAVQSQLDQELQRSKALEEQAKCTALIKDLATCNARAKTLDDDSRTKTGTITDQKSQIEALTEQAKCTDLNAKEATLKTDVSNCQTERKTLTGQVSVLTGTIANQKVQIEALTEQAKCTVLNAKVAALDIKVTTLNKDVTDCQTDSTKRIDGLVLKMEKCEESKAALVEIQKQELISRQAAFEAAAKIAAEKLVACQKDAAAASQDESSKLASTSSLLQKCDANVVDLNSKLLTCGKSLNQCENTVSKLDGLLQVETIKFNADQDALKGLKTEGDRLRALLEEHAKTIAAKQAAFDALQDKTSDIALKLKLEILSLVAAQAANAKLLQEKLDQHVFMAKQIADRQEDLNKRVAEIDALRKETAQDTATLKTTLLACQIAQETAANKATLLGNSLKQCDASADICGKSLGTCTAALSTSEGTVLTLKASKVALDSEVAALKTEISDVTQKHSSTSSSLTKCETNLADAKTETASTKKLLLVSEGTVSTLKTSNSAFEIQVGTLQADITKQQSSIAQCQNNLVDAKTEFQSTKLSLSQAQSDITTLKFANTECKSNANALEIRVVSMEGKVTDLTASLTNCNDGLGTANANLASTKKILVATEGTLSELKVLKSDADKQIASLQVDKSSCAISIATCQSSLDAAKTTILTVESSLDQRTKERNAARLDAENLSKIKEQQLEQIASLTTQSQIMTLDLKQRTDAITSLEGKLKIETDKFDAASASLKALQAIAEQLQAQVASDNKALSDKQAAYTQLSDKTSAEALKLKSDINELKTSKDAAAKDLQDKEAQLTNLTKEVADRQADLNKRIAEVEALRKEFYTATQEIAKLQSSLQTVTALEAAAQKDLVEREALAAELQKQVDAMKVSLQSCQSSATAAANQCDAKAEALSESLKKVNAAYEQSKSALDASKTQVVKSASDLEACQFKVNGREKEIATLEVKLSQCDADKTVGKDLKEAALKKQEYLEKEASEFREMIKQLSLNHDRKFDDLMKLYSEAKDRILSVTTELAKCANNVDKERESNKVDELAIKSLNQQKKDLEVQMDAHREQIASLKEVIEDKKQSIRKLMIDLTKSKDNEENAANEIAKLKKEIAVHEAEMKKLQVHILDLNDQYKSAIKRISFLTDAGQADELKLRSMGSTLEKYKTELSLTESRLKEESSLARQRALAVRMLVHARNASRKITRSQEQEIRLLVRKLKSLRRSENADDIRLWIVRQLQELNVQKASSSSASGSNENLAAVKSASQVTPQ